MAGTTKSKEGLPDQGDRIPRSRRGSVTVPGTPSSSSSDGLSTVCPAGAVEEAESAKKIHNLGAAPHPSLIMDSTTKEVISLPPQGSRTPSGRQGAVAVPGSLLSSSNDGLTGDCTARSPAELAIAKGKSMDTKLLQVSRSSSLSSLGSQKPGPACSKKNNGREAAPNNNDEVEMMDLSKTGPPLTDDFVKPKNAPKKGGKRRANASPEIVSSEEESTATVAASTSTKGKKKRQKKKRAKVNVISSDESGDDTTTIGRTTSMDTLNEGSVNETGSIVGSIAGSTRSKGPAEVSKDLAMMEASEVAEQALNLLEQIDEMRGKSKNIQGGLSGKMKARIGRVKEAVVTLMGRTGTSGDTAYLKMRNAELSVQLNASKQESARLKAELTQSQKLIDELQLEVRRVSMGHSPKKPERRHQGGMRLGAKSPDDRQRDPSYTGTDDGLAVYEPSASNGKGNTHFQPEKKLDKDGSRSRSRSTTKERPNPERVQQRENTNSAARRRLHEIRDCDDKILKQIENLKKMRRELYSSAKLEMHTEKKTAQGKPRIVSDVMLVPPRMSSNTTVDMAQKQSQGETTWATVVGRKKGLKNKSQQEKTTGNAKKPIVKRNNNNDKIGREGKVKRRPPRTAAVSIKNISEDHTDAEIIRKARTKISLGEIGIINPKIRKAANGSILVEISGPEKAKKVNTLAEKLKEVLQNDAKVSTPQIKGELRIIGIDESITREEVAGAIADAGGGSTSDVKVGQIRSMTNGLGLVWAQCPLEIACRAARGSSLKVGWTSAKIELLKARPMQCYKCWEYGHLAVNCRATRNLIGACYRCGLPGHNARECSEKPRCVICAEKGLDDQHMLGSSTCSVKSEAKSKSKGRSKTAPPVAEPKHAEPARGAEEMEIN